MENRYSSWRSSLAWNDVIPHYYGDYVRSLFIAMAVLSFVVIPVWGDLLPFGIVPQIGASVLLVLLAGFTSARNFYLMLTNATLAAVSIVLLETYAVVMHPLQSTELFVAREAGVLIMLAALYFSVKTARSMMSGKIGHNDSPLEFEAVQEIDVVE
jgi:hypothetical protein